MNKTQASSDGLRQKTKKALKQVEFLSVQLTTAEKERDSLNELVEKRGKINR